MNTTIRLDVEFLNASREDKEHFTKLLHFNINGVTNLAMGTRLWLEQYQYDMDNEELVVKGEIDLSKCDIIVVPKTEKGVIYGKQ